MISSVALISRLVILILRILLFALFHHFLCCTFLFLHDGILAATISLEVLHLFVVLVLHLGGFELPFLQAKRTEENRKSETLDFSYMV